MTAFAWALVVTGVFLAAECAWRAWRAWREREAERLAGLPPCARHGGHCLRDDGTCEWCGCTWRVPGQT